MAYRQKLERLVDEMHRSLLYWLKAGYNVNTPKIATDASPALALRKIMRDLGSRWQTRFDEAAPLLAEYFSVAAYKRSHATLARILKKAGFTVKLQLTPVVKDVLNASIGEQVGLIKSIAQQHLTEVQGLVMRSIQEGRNLGTLADELIMRYHVTRRRASLIARDQNNKATALITRAQQMEVGITHAVWMHSHGGNKPRPSHVKAGKDKTVYDIAKGWYDPDEDKWIWPGTLINCRCGAKPVIPGLGLIKLAQDKAPPGWVEQQHPRDENGKFVVIQNGIVHPKAGTTTNNVWKIANAISNKNNTHATKKEVMAEAAQRGMNPNTIATQYSLWAKFHNAKGKPILPVAPAPATAPEVSPVVAQMKQQLDQVVPLYEQVLKDKGWQKQDGYFGNVFVNPQNTQIELSIQPDSSWVMLDDEGTNDLGEGKTVEELLQKINGKPAQQPVQAEPVVNNDTEKIKNVLTKNGFKVEETYGSGDMLLTNPDNPELGFYIESDEGFWSALNEDGDQTHKGQGFEELKDYLKGLDDKAQTEQYAQQAEESTETPFEHYHKYLGPAEQNKLDNIDGYLVTMGFNQVPSEFGYIAWSKGNPLYGKGELFSFDPDTGEWAYSKNGVVEAEGEGLQTFADQTNTHAEEAIKTPAPVAAIAPSSPSAPVPAPTPTPGQEMSPEAYKPAVKDLAKQKGYVFKVGNDTYTYFHKPDGSKLSINQKLGTWAVQQADGQTIKGKGFTTLHKQLNSGKVHQPSPPTPAPAVASPVQPQAPSKPTAATPVKLSPDLIGAKLSQIGIPKEGTFNSGIEYWKGGGKQVSFKPDTGTWQVKNNGTVVASGSSLEKLDQYVHQIAPDNIAAEWKAGKLPKIEQPKPKATYTPPPPIAPFEIQGSGKHAPITTSHGTFHFSTHGVPLPNALPSNEQSAITTYTGSSYYAMNTALRNGAFDSLSAPLKSAVLRMQAAFAKIPGVAVPVTVGRKIGLKALESMCQKAGLKNGVADLQIGHVIMDEGFVSTSHNPNVWSGDVRFRVTIPKGAKAIYAKGISNYSSEDETILPTGTRFKVNKVEQIGGIYNLHVEVVV